MSYTSILFVLFLYSHSSDINGNGSRQPGLLNSPPLSILLPSILVPVAMLICLSVVCFRCYRRHVRTEQRYLAASTRQHQQHHLNNHHVDTSSSNKRHNNGLMILVLFLCMNLINKTKLNNICRTIFINCSANLMQ